MTQRRGLGKGLGALIPTGGVRVETTQRTKPTPVKPPINEAADNTTEGAVVTESTTEETVATPQSEVVVDLRDGVVPNRVTHKLPRTAIPPDAELENEPHLQFREIPVNDIDPNPQQPRQVFDEEGIAELVHSLQTVGLLQPIVVRPVGDRFELVAGERRLRAAKLAEFAQIPALIRHTADDVMLRDALLENLHRVQLNPLEEAAAYSQLLADFSCTQDELAQRVGRSRPQVANTIRLLKLPATVQRRVAAGVLSAGHARAILGAPDPSTMEALAGRVVAEGLSVRAVEELVIVGPESPPKGRSKAKSSGLPLEFEVAAERLSELLETRVKVTGSKKKGRILIEFAGLDDFARLIEAIDSHNE